jgi:hypothetical protein
MANKNNKWLDISAPLTKIDAEQKIVIDNVDSGHDDIITEQIIIRESTDISYANERLESGVIAVNESADYVMNKSNTAWVQHQNTFRASTKPNKEVLPAGIYDIDANENMGIFLRSKKFTTDQLFTMPDPTTQEIINELEIFWNRREKYAEYGITYKRGIMMYGIQGTGKTTIINLMCDRIVSEYDGIVLNVEDLGRFIPMVTTIRQLEPDKPILAIIEELDSFISYNSLKKFLTLLDGNLQVDNICYIATTNYIEKIPMNIKNRPSRFDSLYQIHTPNPEVREFFIKNKLKPSDLEVIDLQRWVNDTEDMTISHIKDLIISVIVMGNPYDKSIAKLKKMNEIE